MCISDDIYCAGDLFSEIGHTHEMDNTEKSRTLRFGSYPPADHK